MRTLLIAGFGDVAQRAMPTLIQRWRVIALVRRPETAALARKLGARPLLADLDDAKSLARAAALADALLYTAPPPQCGCHDTRLRKLLSALIKTEIIPQRVVYISTTGVYGDALGRWLDETSPLAPESDRARRRLDAETQIRRFAIRTGCSATILRAPGIYASERLPLARLESGPPLFEQADDSFGNHIHADDLAGIAIAALERLGGIRVYNACDDQPMLTGDWYDALADTFGRPRLVRADRDTVRKLASPAQWSFLRESRRLSNRRLSELRIRLRYPSVRDFLKEKSDAPSLAPRKVFG
ncbi:NAD(P)H-binding protein [Paludibacterium paludis]|uniref:NAD-dependent dehydratase n=1 Tax=Paludibacterium paludis TaxID=1225769 RepID=A0A918P024_9NEIS|nr:NAD(P)H-binding protein [Paludibacterium paludis]GGY07939.1 NAD-dependent dehydratase [Paludibacterium paludis]